MVAQGARERSEDYYGGWLANCGGQNKAMWDLRVDEFHLANSTGCGDVSDLAIGTTR